MSFLQRLDASKAEQKIEEQIDILVYRVSTTVIFHILWNLFANIHEGSSNKGVPV